MKVTFVGTGSGKTSLNRYHSSLLFSSVEYNLLVDAGDGVSRALLEAGITYNSINGILFTHFHPDHFSGLGALVVQMKMSSRMEPLEIFVHEKQVESVKEYLLCSNLLPEKMDFEILYKPFSVNMEFSAGNELKILPRENSHLAEIKKIKKYKRRNFFSGSFLFSCNNKHLIYTGDIGAKEDLLLFRDFDADIFICEITHLNILELMESLNILNCPEIYLTHISDNEVEQAKVLLKESGSAAYNILLAEDRQTIEF